MSIFISYSRKDIDAVKNVVDFLDKEFGRENIYFANREKFVELDAEDLIDRTIARSELFLNFDSINTYSYGATSAADLGVAIGRRPRSGLKGSYYFLARERRAAIEARIPVINILLSGQVYLNDDFTEHARFDLSMDLNTDDAKQNLVALVQNMRGIMDAQLFS